MIDLLAPSSEGPLHLVKIAIRRDGTATGSLAVDLDLAAPISSEEEAEIVDRMVPGARSLWSRSIGGAEDTARFGRTPADLQVHGTLTIPDLAEPEIVFGRSVSITRVTVAVNAKARTYIVRMRVGSVSPEQIASLCGVLDERISLAVSSLQLNLFAGGATSVPNRTIREIVSLRSDTEGMAEWAFGALVDENDLSISVRDLLDEMPTVYDRSSVEVVSRLRIDASEPLLRAYRTRAAEFGIAASWGDLIVALGREYGEAGPGSASGGVWSLDIDHIREALGGISIEVEDDDDDEPVS